ncbi:hypothetical protein OG738_17310 [Amycolatopsis sp. NBC_01488]|uniref:hypothetical protein n=1 Tax=Amycolatopsis sp. NBC_01488 TaxID=2903563 RepID=UPI002E2BBF95|nr:hypothetical protein [Amycolatopsis sp. NBC_01488]
MILRTELRRSIAPWAGLAVLVVALGFLFLLSGPWWKAPADWTSQTTTAALWVRFLLVFLWPIVVGAGTIQGIRDSRSGMTELLATTSRPPWHRAAMLAAAVGGLSAFGYLLVFAAGMVEVVAHGGFVSAAFVPIVLVGVLAVVAGAWLGLAVGRLLPHPLTAPAAAVLSLVLMVLLWSALDPETWTSSVIGSPRIGLLGPAIAQPHGTMVTTATAVDLGQAVWFTGLALTAFLLLAATSARGRLLGLLPVAVAVAVALPLLPSSADAGLSPDDSAARRVCDGPVCVAKLHEASLPLLASVGRDVLRQLEKIPGAPTRVDESTAAVGFALPEPRDPGAVLVDYQSEPQLLDASGDELRRVLLAGAGTPSCLPRNAGELGDTAARTVSASWFTGELRPLPRGLGATVEPGGVIDTAWRAFRQLPAAEQQRRIAALRQYYLRCPDGDPLAVLVPGLTR